MRTLFRLQVFFITVFFSASALADPVLRGATLPSARTVARDQIATAFFTVLNSGDTDATNCSVATSTYVGSDLNEYIMTSQLVENGVAVGSQNPSFTIPASGRVDMVFGVARDPAGSFNTQANVFFRVDCDGGFSSPAWPSVNQFSARFIDTAPDIIPIVDTLTRDGIVTFNGNRVGLVTAAAINIGSADVVPDDVSGPASGEATIDVGARYTGFDNALNYEFRVCETDNTGTCNAPPITCRSGQNDCLSAQIGDTPSFFAFFIDLPEDRGAIFAPQTYRFEPTFKQVVTSTTAATSVALAATRPLVLQSTYAQCEMQLRNTDDATGTTLTDGVVAVTEDGGYGEIYRTIDRGALVQVARQRFFANWNVPPGEQREWSDFTFNFLDSRDPGDTRANDHYTVTPDRGACAADLDLGGTCNFSDGPGEQVAGEPEIFDAGEPFSVAFACPELPEGVGPETAGMLSAAEYWSLRGLTVTGFETSQIQTEIIPASGANSTISDEFKVTVDGCTISIILQTNPPEVGGNYVVTGTAVLLPGCPNTHRIGSIFDAADPDQGREISFIATARRAFFSNRGLVVSFTLAANPSDPDGPSVTFDMIVE